MSDSFSISFVFPGNWVSAFDFENSMMHDAYTFRIKCKNAGLPLENLNQIHSKC